MKSKIIIFAISLVAITSLSFNVGLPVMAAEDDSSQALAELSSIVGQEIKDKVSAKEVCNQEKNFVSCAEIGKKYKLYKTEQIKEVDAVLGELKGNIADELKGCADEACLVGVANKLASKLVAKNPALATSLDLTPKKIEDKRVIIDAAKEAGVDLRQCQTLDPDTASVDTLRACARLAKNSTVQKYIPRERSEMADKSADLKIALESGKYSCGDNTLDGCGKFCMSPTYQERGKEPPAICKQIAKEIFGADGVKELEKAYGQVGATTEFYNKQFKNLVFETADGRTLYNPMDIGNYLQGEGEKGNVEVVERGLDFMIANGFAKPEDKEFVLKMVGKVGERGGGIPDFNECAKDPRSCADFIPENRKEEFEAVSRVGDIMSEELKKEGLRGPSDCHDPKNGEKCVVASKRALPQLEVLADKSPEARRISDDIKQKIQFGEEGMRARDEAMKKFKSDGKINIGGNEFSDFGQVQKFCEENGQKCLEDAAKQGFVQRDFAAQKFEQAVNIRSDFEHRGPPQQFEQFPGQNPQEGFPGQGAQYGRPEGQPYQPQPYQRDERPNIMPPQPYQPWEKGVQPPFLREEGGVMDKFKICPASPVFDCKPGEEPQLINQECNTYSCYKSVGQHRDYSSDCVRAGGIWDASSNYCKMPDTTVLPRQYQGSDQVSHTWRFSDGSQFSQILSRTDVEYQDFIRSIDEQCLKIPKDKFTWKQGAGDPSSSNWKNFGIPDCSGSGVSRSATTCPSGQYIKDDACVAIIVTDIHRATDAEKAGCIQAGGTWDTATFYCKMPGASSCKSNQFWSGTACVDNVDPAVTCPKSGGVWDTTTFYCKMPGQSSACTGGQWWDSASQTCKSSNATMGSSCTSSQYWNGTSCVDGASQNCPGGQFVNGACSYGGSSTGGSTCGSGQYWNGSACISNTTTSGGSGGSYSSDPATGCSQAGGTWNASSNYCQMPNQSMPSSGGGYTAPSGGVMTPPPGATLFGAVKSFFINLFK
ncbi:MAG: hypothetical protein HZA94_02490 [Candidatus Vogelbacteria bacterium]|nr:hypothetical protein [Candidatus Vogelbacteria bacterium]